MSSIPSVEYVSDISCMDSSVWELEIFCVPVIVPEITEFCVFSMAYVPGMPYISLAE